MGGGKDRDGHDESDKGLLSNLTHAVAGGHNPSGHYPPQGYPPKAILHKDIHHQVIHPKEDIRPKVIHLKEDIRHLGIHHKGTPQEVILVRLPHITQALVAWEQCWLVAPQQQPPPMAFHIWHREATLATLVTEVLVTLAMEMLCMAESSSMESMENLGDMGNSASIRGITMEGNSRNGSDLFAPRFFRWLLRIYNGTNKIRRYIICCLWGANDFQCVIYIDAFLWINKSCGVFDPSSGGMFF